MIFLSALLGKSQQLKKARALMWLILEQEKLDYGMSEHDADKFRQRRVFGLIREYFEDVKNEKRINK